MLSQSQLVVLAAFAILFSNAGAIAQALPAGSEQPIDSDESEDSEPQLGITNGDFPPDVVGKGFRLTKNSWEGYVGDQLFDAAGTAYVDNPKQGVVFVMKRGDITSIDTYDTPTATGPVEIVSVQGVILTLNSAAGTYRANDPADGQLLGIVKAPGGATYHFNVETRSFQ
jgi:hypothetical protein